MIVLFMFTMLLFVCGCLTITFTRWMYVRTIRNKCDVLKKKYEEEGKSKKEMDFKMKEISMRPVHAHHYHQFGRQSERHAPNFSHSSTVAETPVEQDIVGPQKPAFPVCTPSERPRTQFLFTGHTPLSSPHPLQPSTSPRKDSKTTSSAPVARSSTPTVTGPSTVA
ncbi:hypothetical protein COOONC_18612 [Cooperia oncophora]